MLTDIVIMVTITALMRTEDIIILRKDGLRGLPENKRTYLSMILSNSGYLKK